MKRARALAAALALWSPLLAAGSQDEARTRVLLQPYLDIVDTYRTASPELAVVRLGSWTSADVDAAHRRLLTLAHRLRSPPESPDDLDVGLVEAAILLHTDVALAALQKGDAETGTLHLDVAQGMVEWLHRQLPASGGPSWVSGTGQATTARVDPRLPRLDHRAWYLAIGRLLPSVMQYEQANALLKTALERFPDHADLWLAAGVSLEGAAKQRQLGLWLMNRPVTTNYRYVDYQRAQLLVNETRQSAIAAYRRALAIEPGLEEGRLRLGRVLFDRGDTEEAERLLRELVANRPASSRLYLAHLFLGRLQEGKGAIGQAVESYQAALTLEPACQACRVALAHALDRAGDTATAREIVLALTVEGGARERPDDPWWVYPYGLRAEGEQLLGQLRRGVRRW